MTDVRKVLEVIAAIQLWRDHYPDGPDMLTDGSLCNAGIQPEHIRAARQALSTLTSEQVGKINEDALVKLILQETAPAILEKLDWNLAQFRLGSDVGRVYLGSFWWHEINNAHKVARAILSRLSLQEGVKVPDGWKLVPIEPTVAMMQAGYCAWLRADKTQVYGEAVADHCYSAMLAAAPLPSTPTDRKETP